MKLVGVENNKTNFGYGANWLITSDKPINQNSYYFEVEFDKSVSVPYSTGFIGYTYKYPTGFEYILDEDNRYRKIYCSSFVVLNRTYENVFHLEYINTKTIEINKGLTNTTPNMFISSRVGLGIELKSDKTANLDVYINGKLKDQITKKNFDDFDFSNLYITTFNQWDHNNQTAQYYFDKDLKYQNIAQKYLRNAVLFESGGGVYKMSENNFQKLSDHKWDEISKDEKLSLLEQTKGSVPTIDQLKTLDQPIRVVTKTES